jgi:hypothetical protein
VAKLRPIVCADFPKVEPAAADLGVQPRMVWLEIAELGVDPVYQRDIGDKGRKNVIKIARDFNWSKFSPVIVAPSDVSGRYAIIDGQHRATAAAIRGIKKVPCQVVRLSQAEQAAAFSAINGNITALNRLQIHRAALIAQDPAAVAIDNACKAAGVEVIAYPRPASKLLRGETLAVAAIGQNIKRYGVDTVVIALCCITKTKDGNPGLVRAALISALCVVLDAEPPWRDAGAKLFKALCSFDFSNRFDAAAAEARRGTGRAVAEYLIEAIGDHLDKHLKVAA